MLDMPEGKGIYVLNQQQANRVKVGGFDLMAEFAYIQLARDGQINYAVLLRGEDLLFEGEKVDFIELCKKGGL